MRAMTNGTTCIFPQNILYLRVNLSLVSAGALEFSEGDETMTVKQTQPTAKQQAAMYVTIGKQLASSYPWWAMLIAFLLGVAVGLIVLGWWLWPVQWTQAKPASLSNDPDNNKIYMQSFLNFAATTYGTNSMSIEQTAKYLGEGWTVQDVSAVLQKMIDGNFAGNQVYLKKFQSDLNAYVQGGGTIGPPGASTNVPGISKEMVIVLAGLALIAGILLAWLIVRRLRSEKPSQMVVSPPTGAAVEAGAAVIPAVSRAAGGARPVEKTAWIGETRSPLTQFASTYAYGDDRYDMSSSIETVGGDFLGECGVGISETIGTGTPEKVTALEVWVFDKNDVRTVTKVLMSEYAFNDPVLRAKLAPKGDAVLAQSGEVVELKTQTLKINARIVDVVYGGGTPANSYFQQVTLELATWSDSQ
jgi:hypothetical protein